MARIIRIYDPTTNTWEEVVNVQPPDYSINTMNVAIACPTCKVFCGGDGLQSQVYNVASDVLSDEIDAPSGYNPDYYAATLLQDGKILVTGGWTNTPSVTYFNQSWIFNPEDLTWTQVSNMQQYRAAHTLTTLHNGKVLACGGVCTGLPFGGEGMNSSELYDPETDTWSYVGLMNQGRSQHTATLMPLEDLTVGEGKKRRVLIVGGIATGLLTGTRKVCEYFDPETGLFTTGPLLDKERFSHTTCIIENPTQWTIVTAAGFHTAEIDTVEYLKPSETLPSATVGGAAGAGDGCVAPPPPASGEWPIGTIDFFNTAAHEQLVADDNVDVCVTFFGGYLRIHVRLPFGLDLAQWDPSLITLTQAGGGALAHTTYIYSGAYPYDGMTTIEVINDPPLSVGSSYELHIAPLNTSPLGTAGGDPYDIPTLPATYPFTIVDCS